MAGLLRICGLPAILHCGRPTLEFVDDVAVFELLLEIAERVISPYQLLQPKRVYLEGEVHYFRELFAISLEEHTEPFRPNGNVNVIFGGSPLVFEEAGGQLRWLIRSG